MRLPAAPWLRSLLCSLLAGVGVQAADTMPRICAAVPVRQEQPVRIDGNTDEAAWDRGTWVEGFSVLGAPDRAAAQGSAFRVLYSAEALFIAVKCTEPDVASLLTADTDIWKVDSVEVFVRPRAGGPCWQAVVGVNGARAGYLLPGGRFPVDGWQAMATVGPDSYSVEVSIPFALPDNARPNPGDVWRFNVARNATTPNADLIPGKERQINSCTSHWTARRMRTEKSSAGR